MSDIFDFGFTAVTEDELEYSQKAVAKATQAVDEANSVQERLDDLYNSVIPLLTNLKKNRLDKVEEFETMITKIYKG